MPARPLPTARPPARYAASRVTVWVDRFMNRFITVGGLAVIAAVAGICVFIVFQVLPLFHGATVTPQRSVAMPAGGPALALGADEWVELPFVVGGDGRVHFQPVGGGAATVLAPDLPADFAVRSVRYLQRQGRLLYGSGDARYALVGVRYERDFAEQSPRVVASLRTEGVFSFAGPPGVVLALDFAAAGEHLLAAAIIAAPDGRRAVRAQTLAQKRSLLGVGQLAVVDDFDLTAELQGEPRQVLVADNAGAVLVGRADGAVVYYRRRDDACARRQVFSPFPGAPAAPLAELAFLFGGGSLVCTNEAGASRIFGLYPHADEQELLWGETRALPPLPAPPSGLAPSLRNKAFLQLAGTHASLRYGTTGATRWASALPYRPTHGLLTSKYDHLLLLDDQATLHVYGLHDPHPEAGLRAFFGKLWYEGSPAPSYEWQSTGASDDYEPKLSLVPLLIGTLKGTLYAMLLAAPLALLAALYTSQFQHPRFRGVVKPTMEVMASLPSVVLGFLAALWLAPLLEQRVPAALVLLVLLPLGGVAAGLLWPRLPLRWRGWVPRGYEFLALLPVLAGLFVVALWLGPWLERLCFTITDPSTGERVADFRRWWPLATGARYEQRNALVVGFVMGFAVIPIIFTIAEDALSSVPRDLTSASLALGASRWQTAVRVVLPTASGGVFSALMVGFGRAVGETMIVVMATGNTPVLNFNPFSGFRTLSANIAVELPEAPYGGTLYRALFLGALLLFALTFVVNTIAEVLRQHLRQKYRTV